MTFFANFRRSALELKSLRCLCVTAVLIALDLVLKTFVNVQITEELKLNFAFVAVAAIGMLYGPTVAGLACAVTDVLGYLLKPSGSFSPLFTVIEMTGGVIYGCFLYNLSVSGTASRNGSNFGRTLLNGLRLRSVLMIVFAKVTVAVVCNLIMTPLAITLQKTWEAGVFNPDVFLSGLWTRISTRLVKNSIEAPAHILILTALLPPIKAAYNTVFNRGTLRSAIQENDGKRAKSEVWSVESEE